jgi:hypothetical protein
LKPRFSLKGDVEETTLNLFREAIDAQFVDHNLKQEELEKEMEASRNGRVTAVTNFFESVDVLFRSQHRITNLDMEGGVCRVNSSNELVYD